MAAYSVERDFITTALDLLLSRLPTEAGDVDLANAIDHLGVARELLGGEKLERAACPECGSTEGSYVPPGSGDAACLHCGADWPVAEEE